MNNGKEKRNIRWQEARAKYNISQAVKTQVQLDRLLAFFRICKGRALGFRFKDWSDYQATNQLVAPTGESNQFQLLKHYQIEDITIARIINKPCPENFRLYVGGHLTPPEYYNLNHTTGIVTIAKESKDSRITASFTFDVPVRFDSDYLPCSLDNYGSSSLNDMPLIEIKL
jgi:uncharacterized protein (TIGR02217 family)